MIAEKNLGPISFLELLDRIAEGYCGIDFLGNSGKHYFQENEHKSREMLF